MAGHANKRRKTEVSPGAALNGEQFLVAAKRMGRCQLIFVRTGTRYMCSDHVAFTQVPTHAGPGLPEPHVESQAYLLTEPYRDTPRGRNGKFLDNAFINNWEQNAEAMDVLFANPHIARIVHAIHGPDAGLCPERGWARAGGREFTQHRMQQTLHRDATEDPGTGRVTPGWAACKHEDVPGTVAFVTHPGFIGVIALDQARVHGVPNGGRSDGPFMGVLPQAQFAAYVAATLAVLQRRPDNKQRQVWEALTRKPFCNDFNQAMAATLLYGARPVLYSSLKPVSLPQPFNGGAYPFFIARYRPPHPGEMPGPWHTTQDVLARILQVHGTEAHSLFKNAAALLTHTRVDISAVSSDVLMLYFE